MVRSDFKDSKVCGSCNGAGAWVNCSHGANCDCSGYEDSCEECGGTGRVPVTCPECFEAEMPQTGLVCDACLEDILANEEARLPFVLETKIDRLFMQAEQLESESLFALLADDEVAS